MFALANPGVYTASNEIGSAVWTLFVVLMVVGITMIVMSAVLETEALVFVGIAILAFGAFLPVLTSAETQDSGSSSHADYNESVQDWLAHDYDIDVNDKDIAKLTDGDELAITIDGQATAVEIIEGEKDTIAVKVVGGSILQPTAG